MDARNLPDTAGDGRHRRNGTGRSAVRATRCTLSPLNRRRWTNFKSNRRGYWSLLIFSVLFVGSLFAEFIANDRPFYVRFDGHSFFPALGRLSGNRVRRRFRDRGRLPRSVFAETHRRQGRLHAVAADPLSPIIPITSICRRRPRPSPLGS